VSRAAARRPRTAEQQSERVEPLASVAEERRLITDAFRWPPDVSWARVVLTGKSWHGKPLVHQYFTNGHVPYMCHASAE